MAIIDLNTIKSFFKTGLKPTQNQFWNTWDSFRHKSEAIGISEVTNLQTQLNTLFQMGEVGVIPNSETIIVDGNFSKDFTAGKVLESILIDPTGNAMYSIDIGTTEGGTEITEGFTIDAEEPEQFIMNKFFKTAKTWFFSNVPANTTVTFFYK